MSQKTDNDWYLTLRQGLNRQLHRVTGRDSRLVDYLLLLPDLVYVIYRLLSSRSVSFNHKAFFVLVLFYLFTPFDLVPEVLFGPLGYLEDIPLTVIAFDLLFNRPPARIPVQLWPGDPSMLKRIQRGIEQLNGWVGEGLWQKFKNRFE